MQVRTTEVPPHSEDPEFDNPGYDDGDDYDRWRDDRAERAMEAANTVEPADDLF